MTSDNNAVFSERMIYSVFNSRENATIWTKTSWILFHFQKIKKYAWKNNVKKNEKYSYDLEQEMKMSNFDVNKYVLNCALYRLGTLNSNTVNSKFHLIQSFFEIFARFLSFHV